jgi:hypothetical protein
MSAIPLHLQRRCEQRWAARFVSRVGSVAPKSVDLKETVGSLPRAAKAKEEPADLSSRHSAEGGSVHSGKSTTPQTNRNPRTAETGERIPARPHDSGSQANETVDGLDSTAEVLRHAAEDTASGAASGDIEKTPVFDRAGLAPTI